MWQHPQRTFNLWRRISNRRTMCFFNSVLHHERTPAQWAKNVLVPIFKGKGKSKSDPGSYRPVSLMPCLSKLFEKIVLKRLNNALAIARPNFPNPQQQGFRKHLSCITTAFNLQETIFSSNWTKQQRLRRNARPTCRVRRRVAQWTFSKTW